MSAGTQKWVFVIQCLKEQTGLIFEPLLFRFSVFRASILHSKQNTLHCSQAVLKSLQKSASPQRRVIVSKFNEVNIFLSTHKLQCGIEEICTNLASSFRCSQKIDNPVVFYLPPTALMATCQRLYNLLQPRLLFVPFPLSVLCPGPHALLPPQRSHSIRDPLSMSTGPSLLLLPPHLPHWVFLSAFELCSSLSNLLFIYFWLQQVLAVALGLSSGSAGT